jgi:PadR family transcriptional regulator
MYLAMERETPERGERWEAQLRKGCLELAILAVLWNRRLYGLDILRHLKQASGLEVAEGTLYPILLRLKQDELLDSAWVEAEAGHPRKYYWLTTAGRKRATAMTQTWGDFTKSISRLTVRVKEDSQ